MDKLKEIIERIITEQTGRDTLLVGPLYFPVDIELANGNIFLRSFMIIELSELNVKGITAREDYSAPRENRPPVYSYFNLSEIESLFCYELDIDYSKRALVRRY